MSSFSPLIPEECLKRVLAEPFTEEEPNSGLAK